MRYIFYSLMLLLAVSANGQDLKYSSPKAGNPILPGYFADPTVKKFGNTFYIYSTTDGIKLASGEPGVWVSNDFKAWYFYKLDIKLPANLNNCWAPDVVQGKDGKYYYYMGNCEMGCNIYGYVSTSPLGPFIPINGGNPVIPVGTSRENLPALDAQMLSDNGKLYSFFGTWCTSFKGMGVVQIDANDMHTIVSESFIPISQIPLAFEAAYPLKVNNKYILMYSSGDCRLSSYAVHYSVSDKPEGPYRPGANNPVLETSKDRTVDGPGHHSILKEDDRYYIVYHRHDNPHSTSGEFRQVCVDRIFFENDSTIRKVVPTHRGVSDITAIQEPANLAFGAKAAATSTYQLTAPASAYSDTGYCYRYDPLNAVDDSNGTLWKAASAKLPQALTIDLGKVIPFKRIFTQFEYPSLYYCYKIEVSADGKQWTLFADRTANKTCGSPMVDDADAAARFIRLTITGTQKAGMMPAVWNMKVYNSTFDIPIPQPMPVTEGPGAVGSGKMVVSLAAAGLKSGLVTTKPANKGTLGGFFDVYGKPVVQIVDGVKAITFDGESYLKLSRKAPKGLGWNAPFTVSAWVYNPEVGEGECLMVWTSRENMLQLSYAAMMYGTGHFGAAAHGDYAVDLPYGKVPEKGKWHHIVLTFDGACESVYVDGKLNARIPLTLFVEPGDILIGASGEPSENFSGSIASIQLYDKAMNESEVIKLR